MNTSSIESTLYHKIRPFVKRASEAGGDWEARIVVRLQPRGCQTGMSPTPPFAVVISGSRESVYFTARISLLTRLASRARLSSLDHHLCKVKLVNGVGA